MQTGPMFLAYSCTEGERGDFSKQAPNFTKKKKKAPPPTHSCRNQTKQITPVDCVAQHHRNNEDVGTRNTSSGHRAIKTRKCQETMIVS